MPEKSGGKQIMHYLMALSKNTAYTLLLRIEVNPVLYQKGNNYSLIWTIQIKVLGKYPPIVSALYGSEFAEIQVLWDEVFNYRTVHWLCNNSNDIYIHFLFSFTIIFHAFLNERPGKRRKLQKRISYSLLNRLNTNRKNLWAIKSYY